MHISSRSAPSRAARTGVVIALLTGGLLSACGASSNDNSGIVPGASTTAAPATPTCAVVGSGRTDDFHQALTLQQPTADGLQVADITIGSGAVPQTGQNVTVQYTGWLSNGTMFDSSRSSGRMPFAFAIGTGAVIKGWDEGVATMSVGGIRRLVIPAALAYGATGSPPTIPANATLTFDIELLRTC